MIKNIVFDFGDVFINLDKDAMNSKLYKLGIDKVSENMIEIAKQYEIGLLSTNEFIDKFTTLFPKISEKDFITAWNAILKDFPRYRLDFLRSLAESTKYRLFLLSNTNDLHISWIQNEWGLALYTEFKNYFEQFYLSHEIKVRKPNAEIYQFLLNENNLVPHETLFIDDTIENTMTAEKLGILCWNIDPDNQDIIDLFSQKEFFL